MGVPGPGDESPSVVMSVQSGIEGAIRTENALLGSRALKLHSKPLVFRAGLKVAIGIRCCKSFASLQASV